MTRLLVVLVACVLGIGLDAKDPPGTELARELEEMLVSDQALRAEIRDAEARGAEESALEALWKKQEARDAQNASRLSEMVEAHGWPRKSVVGDRASMAAFLVVQHAEPSVQRKLLPLLRDAVSQGELKPSHLALLEDRVLTSEGKPQIYGSQLRRDPVTSKLEFFPIEDPGLVNERRASVGLEPIEEYARRFGLEYRPGRDG